MIGKLLGVNGENEKELSLQAGAAVAKIVEDIGLPIRLSQVGVTEEKLADIAKDSFKSGMMKFNPRQPSEEEIINLLESIL
jgi:alcohol dehydrogenase